MLKFWRFFLFIFFELALVSFVSSKRAYVLNDDVVAGLAGFQTKNGGFRLSDTERESVEGTHNALFLSSLLGLHKQIDLEKAYSFVQSLENGDYGYGRSSGSSSDLKSVSDALWSYQLLGKPIPNPSDVATFVKNLRDESTGFFSNRAGETPNLESTFLAFRVLELLNQEADIHRLSGSIHNVLTKSIQKNKDFEYFSFPNENLAPISANYYALYLAIITNFDIQNVGKCVDYILSYQSPEGGFFADEKKTYVTLDATVHGLASLWALQQKFKSVRIGEHVNSEALIQSVRHVQYDLKSAANSYLAISLADPKSLFDVKIAYETIEVKGIFNDRIVQGTHLRPAFAAKAFGVSHPGLSVDTTIAFEKTRNTIDLQWKEEAQRYVAEDAFDTSDKLGEIKFDYTVRFHVAGIGEIDFSLEDIKTIGYGITVASTANFLGKDIQEGEVAGSGTEFTFGVTLRNQTKDNFVSGNFDLVFQVLDSSFVTIHEEKVEGKSNTNPFKFAYTLEKTNIPSGILTFQFSVKNENGVHTVKKVQYLLSTPMVASHITFQNAPKGVAPSYKVGDFVKVSFVPGSFSALKKLEPFSEHKRDFYLDLKSVGGVLLRSIKGNFESGKYTFSFDVAPTLDNLGTNVVSFRYVPSVGEEVILSNYDSELEELFDETHLLKYTVKSELVLVEVQQRPSDDDFFYGNEINFKFKVKDNVSGQYILAGAPELANVYLSLQHVTSGGRHFTSVNQSAVHYFDKSGKPEGFLVRWTINPNAVSGPGILKIVAQDADGNSLALKEKGKEVVYQVNIGGKIEHSNVESFTSARDGPESVFVVEFNLSCQNRPLKDAQLKCIVHLEDQDSELFNLPVATNEDGVYSVSWSAPHKMTPSGNYVLNFYREVDRSVKADSPLFSLSIPFEGKPAQLPVRVEFLVVFLLASLFYTAFSRRSKY